MYSVTSWLGLIGFEDNPTTAIVLHFFKMFVMGSLPFFAANSDVSGGSSLIAPPSERRHSERSGESLFGFVSPLVPHHFLLFRRVASSPFFGALGARFIIACAIA